MNRRTITVMPGDGIGPSIVQSAIQVLEAAGCEFYYEFADAGLTAFEKHEELLPEATLQAIERNQIVLKGPLTTPIGEGFSSINVALRQRFKLYANVRPVVSYAGTQARYQDIDIITVRENTEGMYSGRGQVVSDDDTIAEALSVVTRGGAERIVRFAYELARREERSKVTVVHKANILKSTSGLFLRIAREIAFTFGKCSHRIIDQRFAAIDARQQKAAAVHDCVAADQVHDAAHRKQAEVLGQNFDGVLGADQTRFQHREAGGHPHHQRAANQEIEGVHRILQMEYVGAQAFHRFGGQYRSGCAGGGHRQQAFE